MPSRTRLLAVLLIAIVAHPARAAEQLPDVIPADALVAFGIRDLDRLRTTGDDFLKLAGPDFKDFRLSVLVAEAYKSLGITGGVDETRPVVVAILPMTLIGPMTIAWSIPIKDLEMLSKGLGFEKGALKRDALTPLPGGPKRTPLLGTDLTHCWVRGDRLILGNRPEAVRQVVEGKPAGTLMTPAQRRNLDAADMILYSGISGLGDIWKGVVAQVKELIKPHGPVEERVTQQFLHALECCRYVALGCRVEKDGVLLNLLFGLPQNPPPDVAAFLKTLGPTAGPATVRGLPTDRLLMALATSADGAETATATRLLVKTLLQNTPLDGELFLEADRPLVAAVSASVWGHLRSRRLALYRNSDEIRQGRFSGVAVLDTDDPKKFIREVGEMARYAGGPELDLTEATGGQNVRVVQGLIRDLGSEDFATREAAAVKLALIGEPGLPLLQKAATSDNEEVRRRTELVVGEIKERATARRMEVQNKEAAGRLRPRFELKPAAEMLDGQPVDVLAVTLTGGNADSAARMRELFGPDWARVRLVAVDNHVVVLFGSDVGLLRRTAANVRNGEAGLAGEKALARFQQVAERDRSLELDFALEPLLPLIRPGNDKVNRVPGQYTSIAVGADPGRYEVQMWVPAQQFGAVLEALFGR
jgi:hypothetical protein